MARAKKPTRISATDPAFVRRLEFNLPEDRLQEIDGIAAAPGNQAPDTGEAANSLNAQPNDHSTLHKPKEFNTSLSVRSDKPADPKKEKPGAADVKRRPRPRRAEGVNSGGEKPTVIRLAFGVPTDLTVRAEKWAAKARCSVNTVIQRTFAELRPELIERLEAGIRYQDISNDRATHTAHRFNTSVSISAHAAAFLASELDPEGMSGLTGPLSRWARDELLKQLSKVLAEKGY